MAETKTKIKPLSSIKINLNDVRVAIAKKIKDGTTEMDMESFLLFVREVYREREK